MTTVAIAITRPDPTCGKKARDHLYRERSLSNNWRQLESIVQPLAISSIMHQEFLPFRSLRLSIFTIVSRGLLSAT